MTFAKSFFFSLSPSPIPEVSNANGVSFPVLCIGVNSSYSNNCVKQSLLCSCSITSLIVCFWIDFTKQMLCNLFSYVCYLPRPVISGDNRQGGSAGETVSLGLHVQRGSKSTVTNRCLDIEFWSSKRNLAMASPNGSSIFWSHEEVDVIFFFFE